MSWLTGEASTRDQLLALRPALAADHQAVVDELWAGAVDPAMLELCRLRTASILGNATALAERTPAAAAAGLSEAKIAALASWPTDDRFDGSDRACLALAEQYVIDIHGVSSEQLAAATSAVGPTGMVALTTALAVWELTHRFDNALGAVPDASTTSTHHPDPAGSHDTDPEGVR